MADSLFGLSNYGDGEINQIQAIALRQLILWCSVMASLEFIALLKFENAKHKKHA
ncbi:hypothetical protein [Methylobacter sp.]|uniref:hypothetical protein n=1 Tax=Methylobacter sp. TaxID=2051955 RepID=UPI002FDEA791